VSPAGFSEAAEDGLPKPTLSRVSIRKIQRRRSAGSRNGITAGQQRSNRIAKAAFGPDGALLPSNNLEKSRFGAI
jgi:hypothetical protein